MYSTVKINSSSTDGTQTVGTGFIFKFFRNVEDSVPVFVSNKHVIESSLDGEILMHMSDKNNNVIPDSILVPLDRFAERWITHPDPNVDLAIMPIGPVVNDLLKRGVRPFYTGIDSTTIPRDSEWKILTPIEDILMIGYPHGLWDPINNFPFFKKGSTATHAGIKYGDKEQFVIDVGLYPGSSGSPIFRLTDEFYEKSRFFRGGPDRVRLLGIVKEVFIYNAEGQIMPTKKIPKKKTLTEIPMDLGLAIRSTKLLDFEPILREMGFA
ncbi:MAG TPA: serine protease [Candidatus Bathyarchaeia archaeon]|nr:serine protease [Candidatus Bathyarchaeia archaeon]